MKEEKEILTSQAFRCNLCGVVYWESALIKDKDMGYLCQECTEHFYKACKALRRKIIKSKKQKERKEDK